MCVLCDRDNLRLLVAPIGKLSHRQLAEAVAIAREAAWQLVLDTVDTLTDTAEADAADLLGPDAYLDYVVERAEREGELDRADSAGWSSSLRSGSIYHDARVQAFLSSAVEGLATYIMQVREHKLSLEVFLEERTGAVSFGGIGANGEITFDRGSERYVVMSDEEALRIAMDRLASGLCQEDPGRLLVYTNLPVGAADVLAAVQQGPAERANDILAGIVDLQALTEDRVRQIGYAPFVAEGLTDEFSEARFNDRIIIRLRLAEDP
jgi:hypothetical protein